MHTSIPIETECEIIDLTEIDAHVAKCQIKVCYVSDKPNRNNTIITKEVAKEIAKTLPGCPIVGYYNEETQDFTEHGNQLVIKDGELTFSDDTKPYGFVDINPKVWFQKFEDDDNEIREYLVTEGYLWIEQFPEAERILTKGNNQSMELGETFGKWVEDEVSKVKFFIISKSSISALCILGEDVEPCFEGAQITAPTELTSFSLSDNFIKEYNLIVEKLQNIIQKGDRNTMKFYAYEIGCGLWNSVDNAIWSAGIGSNFYIYGIFQENDEHFCVLKNHKDGGYYKLSFTIDDNSAVTLVDMPVKAEINIDTYKLATDEAVLQYVKSKGNDGQKDKSKKEENTSSNEEDSSKSNTEDGKTSDKGTVQPEKKKKETDDQYAKDSKVKKTCSLEEYDALKQKYEDLSSNYTLLEDELRSLREFKNNIELKEKQELINTFSMLSEDDKSDVINNINDYSYNDIKAKLSIICVDKKVSFENKKDSLAFNLQSANFEEDKPDWLKAVDEFRNN